MFKPPYFDSEFGPYAWDAVVAASSGDVSELRRLISLDPKLLENGWYQLSVLPFAVQEGHLEAVRFLLEAGAEPGFVETAKERGFDEIAALLEDAAARWRRVVPSEETTDHPIHHAAEAGDLKSVRKFIDADSSLVNRSDRSGGTPLHRAVLGRSLRVAEFLLDRGADVLAIHGNGLGSRAGYAPLDHQPIDLAVWSGPRQVRPPKW